MIAQSFLGIDLSGLMDFAKDHPEAALLLIGLILAISIYVGVRWGASHEKNRSEEERQKLQLKAQLDRNQTNVLIDLTTSIRELVKITSDAQSETTKAREAQVENSKQTADLISALKTNNDLETRRIDMRAKALTAETEALRDNTTALDTLRTGITTTMDGLAERIGNVDTTIAEQSVKVLGDLRADLDRVKDQIIARIDTATDAERAQFVALNTQVGTTLDLVRTIDITLQSVVSQMKGLTAKPPASEEVKP